ncbi:MAG: aminotransferase class V-fold PLP-dependent enzyme [Gammaproteobacteria bacterium]
MLDIKRLKAEFPALQQDVYQRPLVYLDNGATTQKPQSVINAMTHYYEHDNANVHRGVHALSQRADRAYEAVRLKAQALIHAQHREEIIYTYGTTDAINLLAHSLGELLSEGDEIIVSEMEHHANIVPWQMLCERKKLTLNVISVNDDGTLNMDQYRSLLSERTKIVSVCHISNVLGIKNPVKDIIELAHEKGAAVVIDAAQSIAHTPIDVQDMGCDFLVFSGHKMYGPTGIGILYGKKKWLEMMPPFRGGGAMISEVRFEKTTYNDLPYKFEAGTPAISAVIGLGAAIDFIQSIGLSAIEAYEHQLSIYMWDALSNIPGLRILGEFQERVPIVSFTMKDAHAHDVATILDRKGVAVRAGHHCAMPLMERFGVIATTRACASIYNSAEDIDCLAQALLAVNEVFA